MARQPMPMQGRPMPQQQRRMPPQQGANMNPLSSMPAEARQALMRPSEEIGAVLMARLANMTPEELAMLDRVISPEVARILVKLLPELQQMIAQIEQMNARKGGGQRQMPQQPQMGALGNMR